MAYKIFWVTGPLLRHLAPTGSPSQVEVLDPPLVRTD